LNTILAPIDDIVAWIITGLYHLLSPVFGVTGGATWVLTIVLLTVIIRLILVPLFVKQIRTQRAMTALTPQLTELRKKYKGDRETLNSETMKLYQTAGVNPMMGCLPMVLQMPIFIALFNVLRYIAEWKGGANPSFHLTPTTIQSAQTAQIFGVSIKDAFRNATSVHVHVVIALVVVTSVLTTYLTMRQSVKRGIMPTGKDNPMGQSQRMMTYIFPLFALSGLIWPFGLVLYWVSTNVWTLGQQFVMLRKYPVGAAVPPGGLPIKGSSPGRPATASGLTGTAPGRPKPARTGGAGGAAGKPAPKRADAVSDATTSDPVTGKASGSGVQDAPPGARVPADANGQAPADRKAKPSAAGSAAGKGTPSGADSGTRVRPSGRSAQSGQSAAGASGGRGDQSRSAVTGSANGHKPAGEGGMLRRISRGRAEPEAPVPAEPEVKLVRQQRQRQSRSKRSGKR
jgi:YidC/Oxa1 family membrane protein insertase